MKKIKLKKRAAPFGSPSPEPREDVGDPMDSTDPSVDPMMDDPDASLDPMEESVDPMIDDPMEDPMDEGFDSPMPRMPDMGPDIPMDVNVNVQNKEVSIDMGGTSITIAKEAKYDPDNPPEKVNHLSEKQQRKWVHVYNSAADDGDDEEAAHKKAWGSVNDSEKKSKQADVDGLISPEEMQSMISSSEWAKPLGDGVLALGTAEGGEKYQEIHENGSLVGYRKFSDDWRSISRDNLEGWKNTPRDMADNARSMQKDVKDQWDFTKDVIKDDINRVKNVFRRHADVDDGRDRDYSDFMRGNAPAWEDPDPLFTDTHEFAMNNPANRRVPETFDVRVSTNDKFDDVTLLAQSLGETLPSEIEEGNGQVTIKDIENPVALIEELAFDGLDAEVVGKDLTNIYEGMKVAFLGDLPELGFQNDPSINTTAQVMAIDGDEYYLYNSKMGHFVAERGEIDVQG